MYQQGNDYSGSAADYARLGIEGSVYLAYRDLPEVLAEYGAGEKILDFGCGAGRSSRFLKANGFDVVGVDVSEAMLKEARSADPHGEYYAIQGALPFEKQLFDAVVSALVFMEYSSKESMTASLEEIKRVLKDPGIIVIAVTSEEQYEHATTTAEYEFPEDGRINSGDQIHVRLKGIDTPIVDYYWRDEDYKEVFEQSGLKIVETRHPLGRKDEPYTWTSEETQAPWSVYVLQKNIHDD